MTEIPAAFAQNMRDVHGAAGASWLAGLPGRLAAYEERWDLRVLPPFEPLSYNYVAPVVQADGTPAVLKVGVPTRELLTEIAALELYGGRGMVRLLAADAAGGALLLERLLPGTPLSSVADDDAATTEAARAMRALWCPAPAAHPFPTTAAWASGLGKLRPHFGGSTGPFPARLVEAAEQRFAELFASAGPPVLLHGDLHHDNILAARRAPWLAIDPKGVVGEVAYEPGALLRNQLARVFGAANPRAAMARRLDILAAELDLDRSRIAGWAFAGAILSAWWSVEDHGAVPAGMLACAELLDSLPG